MGASQRVLLRTASLMFRVLCTTFSTSGLAMRARCPRIGLSELWKTPFPGQSDALDLGKAARVGQSQLQLFPAACCRDDSSVTAETSLNIIVLPEATALLSLLDPARTPICPSASDLIGSRPVQPCAKEPPLWGGIYACHLPCCRAPPSRAAMNLSNGNRTSRQQPIPSLSR